jgi:hypothetical protein
MTNMEIEPTAKQNQIRRVLNYMRTHNGITSYEAITEISVNRLASRICDMKKMGYDITSKWVDGVNKYGERWRAKRYWLVEQEG